MLIRAGLALMWLLHFLPLALLAPIGRAVGMLLYVCANDRRKVALTNLKLCFPDQTDAERSALTRRHFQALGRSLLERGITWWASKNRLQGLIQVGGLEHWRAVANRPVIWFAPHFVGLDMGGTRIITEWRGVSLYSQQKDPVLNRILLHGRTRFVTPVLFSRQDGIRPV